MRTVSLITVLTVVFVAVFMMSFAISTTTAQRNGWQGGVYGSTSLWDTWVSDNVTNSAHAYWIINRTGGSITYTWEFKQGVTHPTFWLDAEETRDGSDTIAENVSTGSDPSGWWLYMDLESEGLWEGHTYTFEAYTRLDVLGGGSWQMDTSFPFDYRK